VSCSKFSPGSHSDQLSARSDACFVHLVDRSANQYTSCKRMRIVGIREGTIAISSAMRNAVVSFSEMDVSAGGVITDIVRDGGPVCGFGFTSNGRYSAGGILSKRLMPRLLGAPSSSLLNDAQDNFDPVKVWRTMMSNEKPGGHGERPTAVAAIDM